jgi:hypothetical protein
MLEIQNKLSAILDKHNGQWDLVLAQNSKDVALQEGKIFFHQLQNLLAQGFISEEAFLAELRLYLKVRLTVISESSEASFFRYFHSPINQACVEIATHIAKPNESIAKILIFTLDDKQIYDGKTLQDITERVRNDGKRQLIDLSNCSLSHDLQKICIGKPVHEPDLIELAYSSMIYLNLASKELPRYYSRLPVHQLKLLAQIPELTAAVQAYEQSLTANSQKIAFTRIITNYPVLQNIICYTQERLHLSASEFKRLTPQTKENVLSALSQLSSQEWRILHYTSCTAWLNDLATNERISLIRSGNKTSTAKLEMLLTLFPVDKPTMVSLHIVSLNVPDEEAKLNLSVFDNMEQHHAAFNNGTIQILLLQNIYSNHWRLSNGAYQFFSYFSSQPETRAFFTDFFIEKLVSFDVYLKFLTELQKTNPENFFANFSNPHLIKKPPTNGNDLFAFLNLFETDKWQTVITQYDLHALWNAKISLTSSLNGLSSHLARLSSLEKKQFLLRKALYGQAISAEIFANSVATGKTSEERNALLEDLLASRSENLITTTNRIKIVLKIGELNWSKEEKTAFYKRILGKTIENDILTFALLCKNKSSKDNGKDKWQVKIRALSEAVAKGIERNPGKLWALLNDLKTQEYKNKIIEQHPLVFILNHLSVIALQMIHSKMSPEVLAILNADDVKNELLPETYIILLAAQPELIQRKNLKSIPIIDKEKDYLIAALNFICTRQTNEDSIKAYHFFKEHNFFRDDTNVQSEYHQFARQFFLDRFIDADIQQSLLNEGILTRRTEVLAPAYFCSYGFHKAFALADLQRFLSPDRKKAWLAYILTFAKPETQKSAYRHFAIDPNDPEVLEYRRILIHELFAEQSEARRRFLPDTNVITLLSELSDITWQQFTPFLEEVIRNNQPFFLPADHQALLARVQKAKETAQSPATIQTQLAITATGHLAFFDLIGLFTCLANYSVEEARKIYLLLMNHHFFRSNAQPQIETWIQQVSLDTFYNVKSTDAVISLLGKFPDQLPLLELLLPSYFAIKCADITFSRIFAAVKHSASAKTNEQWLVHNNLFHRQINSDGAALLEQDFMAILSNQTQAVQNILSALGLSLATFLMQLSPNAKIRYAKTLAEIMLKNIALFSAEERNNLAEHYPSCALQLRSTIESSSSSARTHKRLNWIYETGINTRAEPHPRDEDQPDPKRRKFTSSSDH